MSPILHEPAPDDLVVGSAFIRPQHRRAIKKIVERFTGDPECVAVLLGGSVAKGLAREDSDVDITLVLTDAAFLEHQANDRLSFVVQDLCDYPGGYVDVKVVSVALMRAAAERGSEPTRSSYVATATLFSRDPAIPDLSGKIGIYPLHLRDERIFSFYSQLMLMRHYFWPHAYKQRDPYLQTRAASEMVLYGYRMLLAHSRVLFPCQKALRDTIIALPDKPDGIVALADAFLTRQTEADMLAFFDAVSRFTDWGVDPSQTHRILTRFTDDVEKGWLTHTPALSEC